MASLVSSHNRQTDAGKKSPRSNPPQPQSVAMFDDQRFVDLLAVEHTRAGNALHLLNLKRPLDFPAASNANDSSLAMSSATREAGGWIDAAQPFSGTSRFGSPPDSSTASRSPIAICSATASSTTRPAAARAILPCTRAQRRRPLVARYLLPLAQLRAAHSADSRQRLGMVARDTAAPGTSAALKAAASGNFNPVGYNRVYVYVEGDFTWDKWWDGLRAGRAMVTNGPLIRPSVDGQPPGHVFRADRGQTVELEIGLTLSTRDKVSYLEIVKDGITEHEVRLDKWKAAGGKLPPIKFTESGWFLVRAVTDEPSTYRYATTAPYYVEIGAKPAHQPRQCAILRRLVPRAPSKLQIQRIQPASSAMRESAARSSRPMAAAENYWKDLLNRATAP